MARTPLFHSYHGISCLNSIKYLLSLSVLQHACGKKLTLFSQTGTGQVANPATSTDCPMEFLASNRNKNKTPHTSDRNFWVCLLKLGTELNSVVYQFIIVYHRVFNWTFWAYRIFRHLVYRRPSCVAPQWARSSRDLMVTTCDNSMVEYHT